MGGLVLDHLLSFFSLTIVTLISLFAYKGILKEKPFMSFLIVLSFFGFLISFAISFNLNLGRYFIITYYLITILIFTSKIIRKPFLFYAFLKSNYRIIQFIILIGITSIIYLIYNLNINFLYNGHDPYLYGIPFEIISGDYNSRIKVWDNYPIEWSKYHFFVGSTYSIFLLISGIKNIFLFKLTQLFITIIGLFCLDEIITNPRHKNVFFNSLMISLPIVIWFFSTNGILPLIYITGFFIFYYKKKYAYSFLFIIFFASSLSRHVIPGILISLILLYYHHIEIFKFKKIYLFLPPILNLFSMVFTGKTPLNLNLDYFLEGKFLSSFLHNDWNSYLFQNVPLKLFKDIYKLDFNPSTFLLIFPTSFIIILFIKLNNNRIKIYLGIILFLLFSMQISFMYDNNMSGKILEYSFMTLFLWGAHSVISFSFPLYLLYNYKFNFKIYFLTFYLGSIIGITIFGSGVGIPNYYLISILSVFIILYFEKNITVNLDNFKIITFILILFILIPRMNDSTTKIYNMNNINLDYLKTNESILEYRSTNDTIYPILKSNIFGIRIKHNNNSSSRFHISNSFLSDQ